MRDAAYWMPIQQSELAQRKVAIQALIGGAKRTDSIEADRIHEGA
jgi:hypothetical protein